MVAKMGIEYVKKGAVIDGPYRYSLTRIWDKSRLMVLWIMLNPSTADAMKDDNTIRKIVKISNHNGYGGLYVGNMYAYRATNPKELFEDDNIDYKGKWNYDIILQLSDECAHVIMACGKMAKKEDLKKVKYYLHRKVYCLGVNKDGSPVHPLYQKDTSTFKEYVI